MSDHKKTTKFYPPAAEEVAAYLGLDKTAEDHAPKAHSEGDAKPALLPVADLPVAPVESRDIADVSASESVETEVSDSGEKAKTDKGAAVLKTVKTVLPYAGIFVVGLFLYYFFFSGFNFSGLFTQKAKNPTAPKETALAQLQTQQSDAYYAWVKSYYYDVSDSKITDPNGDNSGNGLTNFQKYLLKLNPKAYDTLGLGMADSQALAAGINPLSGGKITDDQKAVLEKYIDMEVAMNRMTVYALQNPGRVAGEGVGFVLPLANGSVQGSQTTVPQTGADLGIAESNINTDVAGRLEIPSLKVNVPIIWTKDTKNFNTDLQTGVVHYPGTALPGEIGTAYISGHSSNFVWAKGDYNQVFAHLGDLADNTSFKVTLVGKDGRDIILHYVVTGRKEFAPTDQEQFKNTGESVVALSTCWPVGSTAKRLVVFGTLTQVEK